MLKSVSLKNFGIFQDSYFEFNPHFTAIIGDNNSGKTTLLESISLYNNSPYFRKCFKSRNFGRYKVSLEFEAGNIVTLTNRTEKTYNDYVIKHTYFHIGEGQDRRLFASTVPKIIPMIKEVVINKWGKNGIFSVIFEDKKVPLWDLSVSYKNFLHIIGMLCDLGDSPAIVLIDDFGTYLHPNLLRCLAPNLKATFPNIQFIVSTHSPFVIQSLKADEIIGLDKGFGFEPHLSLDRHPNKLGLEEVVECVMGVKNSFRSLHYTQMLDTAKAYHELLESAKTIEDKAELETLRKKLDELLIPFYEEPAFVAYLQLKKLAEL